MARAKSSFSLATVAARGWAARSARARVSWAASSVERAW